MFISQTQSVIMKSIVMLLIILGHNHILVPQDGSSPLFRLLYGFHVSIFFILPFFYDRKDLLTIENIGKVFIRNGVPYFLFFIFCYTVYHFVLINNGFNLSEFLGGFVSAPGYNAKSTTGFTFLWFLPVFLLMSLYKLIGNKYKILMVLFFIIGFIFSVNEEAYYFMRHSSFYLLKATFYYAIGLSAYFLSKYVKYMNCIGTIVFIALIILYWIGYYQISTFYFSLAGFFSLYELTSKIDFSKIPFLSLIGKYSLPIYLTHVFIYNVLERILPHTLLWGILIYFMTIGLSLLISIVIYKIEIIRKVLFPKSWEEWIHFYQTTKALN